MFLEEGKNTYVGLEFANKYVEQYYTKYAPLRVHWSVLNDEEKQQYLFSSLSQIEKLHFTGRKAAVNQELNFPRIYADRYSSVCRLHPNGYPFIQYSKEIPNDVKEAQVENALGLISEQISSISDKQFMTMQSLGAIKNTKYNKREAGDLGFGAELKGGKANVEIASLRAYQLLQPYIGGGFRC